jgi:hypothetical protein
MLVAEAFLAKYNMSPWFYRTTRTSMAARTGDLKVHLDQEMLNTTASDNRAAHSGKFVSSAYHIGKLLF